MPTLYTTTAGPTPPTVPLASGTVPVLSTTLLRLELLQHGNSLDLTAATRILCADPGALLHLFAAVAEHASLDDAPFHRLEDYVASLPFDLLLDRLAGHAVSSPLQHVALTRFADHANRISHYAFGVAGTFQLSGDQALLVGSLHDLEQLPPLLGWQPVAPNSPQAALLCAELCRQYRVPAWLCTALCDIRNQSRASLWTALTSAAHELALAQVNVL